MHRVGTKESLAEDFIVICDGMRLPEAEKNLNKALELIKESYPLNIGAKNAGSECNLFTAGMDGICPLNTEGAQGVYQDIGDVERLVGRFRDENLRLCVQLQGLFSETLGMLRRMGVKPHSVTLSLGTFGRTDLLPDGEALEIVTMCGHGRISAGVVERFTDEILAGKNTPEQASGQLAKICVDAAFNPLRARKLLANATRLKRNSS